MHKNLVLRGRLRGMTDLAALDYVVETALSAGAEWTVAVRPTDTNDNVAVGKIVVRP